MVMDPLCDRWYVVSTCIGLVLSKLESLLLFDVWLRQSRELLCDRICSACGSIMAMLNRKAGIHPKPPTQCQLVSGPPSYEKLE